MPKSVIFLSEVMPLGGTSTFALNICQGMSRTTSWTGIAAGLRTLGEVGEQIQKLGLPLIAPNPSAMLHEERIEHVYHECAKYAPRAVVAALSGGSFDFLRYVPDNCLRIGMIQSDEEGVYELVSKYLPWLDGVAGVSKEICRKMEARMGSERIPVFHQPYGVPMPEVPVQRESKGPLRILYLGRIIEEQKRVNLMKRVMRASLESGASLTWTIAGDGPDLKSLKAEFADSPERVKFLGSVPYQNVPNILTEHDVYFLCSDYEGLPLSLLEAMGAGLVPVVSALPSGISEVVNDQNGIRIPIHDEAAYVDALTRLASDPTRLARLSANSFSEVRTSHSTLAMTQRWESMLDGLSSDCVPVWKPACRGTAPLELSGRWVFHPALRPLRSVVKRLKNWANYHTPTPS